ncbi:MAG: tRNA dihydrouridine synthase DusB [Myxococcales bacterium]|nr:tRNA dihydrouridine synthase DusB [Myxococcales bacterium]
MDLHIGQVPLRSHLVLAPMSGVTDRIFRRLIRHCNGADVGLYVTEFISVECLWRGNKRSLFMMRKDPEESPFCVQLYGRDVEQMVAAGRLAVERGAQIVDINCGCPAPKVVRRGGGAALMKDPQHIARIVEAMVEALPVPITVKLRSGWDDEQLTFLEAGRLAQEAGAAAVALHPRTRKSLYKGVARWGLIAQLAAALRVPVFGSGDVVDGETYRRLFQASGAAGVMLGRGAIENPFLFRELARVERGEPANAPSLQERFQLLRVYYEGLREDYPERPNLHLGRVKNLVNRMTRGRPQVLGLRQRLLRSQTIEDLLDLVAEMDQAAPVHLEATA